MCALLSRAAIAISVFVIVVPLPTWAADVEEVELTIHPQAISEPAMQHRLLPSYLDQRPGNAAPMYLKALLVLAEQNVDAKIWDDVTRLSETPVDELPRDDARDLLKQFDQRESFVGNNQIARIVVITEQVFLANQVFDD